MKSKSEKEIASFGPILNFSDKRPFGVVRIEGTEIIGLLDIVAQPLAS